MVVCSSLTQATMGAESPEPPWPTRPVKLRLPWGLVRVMVATLRGWPRKVMGAPEPMVTAASKIQVSQIESVPPSITSTPGSGMEAMSLRPRSEKLGKEGRVAALPTELMVLARTSLPLVSLRSHSPS